jgi:dihydroorotate dehydrogenase (fumarate)
MFAGVDLIEVNLGCPNVWEGSKQKQIASFNPDLVGKILSWIEQEVGRNALVAVKISPFSDPSALAELADRLTWHPVVKVVTTTNTFPNAFAFAGKDRARPLISVGLAGLAGPAMKPIGLGQVKQLRALLPEHIQIMGVGGIVTGDDVHDYLAAGATCTQIATTFLQQGPRVFSRILEEMMQEPQSSMR